MTIEQLRAGSEIMIDYAGSSDDAYTEGWADAIPIMLDLLEKAIVWRAADLAGCAGCAATLESGALDILARFDAING